MVNHHPVDDVRNMRDYTLVIQHSHGISQFLIGKPSINGPFSMAMLNNQRVINPVFIKTQIPNMLRKQFPYSIHIHISNEIPVESLYAASSISICLGQIPNFLRLIPRVLSPFGFSGCCTSPSLDPSPLRQGEEVGTVFSYLQPAVWMKVGGGGDLSGCVGKIKHIY